MVVVEVEDYEFNNVDVGLFVVSTNVVDFTDNCFAEYEIDCSAVILNIEPVADVFAVTIDRKRFVC